MVRAEDETWKTLDLLELAINAEARLIDDPKVHRTELKLSLDCPSKSIASKSRKRRSNKRWRHVLADDLLIQFGEPRHGLLADGELRKEHDASKRELMNAWKMAISCQCSQPATDDPHLLVKAAFRHLFK